MRTGRKGAELGLFLLAVLLGSVPAHAQKGGALEKGWAAVQDHMDPWEREYRAVFDGKRYVCQNALGEEGYNRIPPEQVIKRKDGECAYLVGVRWEGRVVSEANLLAADLVAAVLTGTNLRRAFLRGARLVGAEMRGAILVKADLNRADLDGAVLNDVQAAAANFTFANLHRARLLWANLNGAYLMEANLAGAFLVRASLLGANLRDANLLGADLTRAEVDENTVFHGAKYDSDTRLPFGVREAEKRGMVKIGS